MPLPQPLPAETLRRTVDPKSLGFKDTSELPDSRELVGQARALTAIDFGARMKGRGYNIFVLGAARSGRHGAVAKYLADKAELEPVPDDWVYVFNFMAPDKPKSMRLPTGIGTKFKAAMAELINDLSVAIPAMFESDDYRNRRKTIDDKHEDESEKTFNGLRDRAGAQNIAILRTPMGFALAPMQNGEVVKPDVFNALPEAERDRVAKTIEALQVDLETILRNLPRIEKKRREEIKRLNEEFVHGIVKQYIGETEKLFPDQPAIGQYLAGVLDDLVKNAELFLTPQHEENDKELDISEGLSRRHPIFTRYAVNLFVTHCLDAGTTPCGSPVIVENHPTLANVMGRIDHRSVMGTLVTNFTLVKPGALHMANGGYLVLDALKVLAQPFTWEALKRSLVTGKIGITSPGEELSLLTTTSLLPDAIPLDAKIILVGDPLLYYLLVNLDPDFMDLFKVQAEFEDVMPRDEKSEREYASLLAGIAKGEALPPMTAAAVGRLLEETSRDAADSERFSLQIGNLADLMHESRFAASERSATKIDVEDVDTVLSQRRRRKELLRERSLEAIGRRDLLIDTDGEVVGQINGLSVLGIGNLSFGRPTRITARVRVGSGKVVDIEREAELGGSIHTKGVLILSGFLATHYAPTVPMSLWASIVFEQSYGGVEGDSASSAELYALLSALSELPIRQSLAVTGSVNQLGHVQAIGGVNEKIEGFFDVCAARGLTGDQGVLIPAANVKHLMLRTDITEAARNGKFSIYPVSHIHEGIEVLTGVPAGERRGDGTYPKGSVNRRVEDRMIAFAMARKAFAKGMSKNKGEL